MNELLPGELCGLCGLVFALVHNGRELSRTLPTITAELAETAQNSKPTLLGGLRVLCG